MNCLVRLISTSVLGAACALSPLSAQSTVDLANFSARSQVGGGEQVTILGIVVTGNENDYRPVLFRGRGPWLTQFGVTNALTDPFLHLFEGSARIGSNDNWQTGGQRYAIQATGYKPSIDEESAFIAMLMPGSYTLHLGGTVGGVGLAEAIFLQEKSIPENLIAAGDFSTLVAAVQAAGLVNTLASDGPFTLFAPTNEAFAALPAGTVEALLADIPTLTNILLYHVVAGAEVRAANVTAGPVMMANGAPASISITDGNVFVKDSKVIEVDWLGTNGVIHVVDKVILPPANPAGQTVVQNLIAQGNFTTLVAAVQAAGLVDTLNSAGPFTVFAPTDAAFAKLPAGTVTALLNDIPTLTDILLYHVVSGAQVLSSQVVAGPVTMANGDPATLSTTGGVKINNATVTGADWRSSNGVIHIVDTVILPP
ncbi:MAG: fasciclin domain-containing protein [Opitutaceae bacterium]|nr:fasciclin domain-containing protein [Opitutaceae bacterium]